MLNQDFRDEREQFCSDVAGILQILNELFGARGNLEKKSDDTFDDYLLPIEWISWLAGS